MPGPRTWLLIGGLIALAWWAGHTPRITRAELPLHHPDPVNGERVFHAGGCASCHGEVIGKDTHERRMAGGLEFRTPYGVFRAPNISTHPRDGIGAWSNEDFLNAMQRGRAPDGSNYYPVFPYTSYARMRMTDLLDLRAYLDTLPPVAGRPADHDVRFPYSVRWSMGVWKRLFLDTAPVILIDETDPLLLRGRELVEGAGHCGECHTPRNPALAMDLSKWLDGAPLLEGEGKASRLSPGDGGLQDWSAADIVYYLETGVDPEFDVVGGPMVAVQENIARLSNADRQAIAAYLKALPASDQP